MTNVCPQDHNLNRGDWKELEEACRDWTMENGRLYVVAGPVLYRGQHRHIGQSRVTVPEAFYKVVFCPEPLKAIGFIYKNKSGNRPLDAYVNSVDEVERITGIDFSRLCRTVWKRPWKLFTTSKSGRCRNVDRSGSWFEFLAAVFAKQD